MSFDADPLLNQKNAFYKGQFQTLLKDTQSEGALALVLRAKVALDAQKYVHELASEEGDLHKAAYALALSTIGKIAESVQHADALIDSPDANIRLMVATIFARDPERVDDAIDVLGGIEDNLEAVALLIQIYLSTHQLSAAQQTLQSAKSWAQDAELIQLAELWVSMSLGGTDNYQSAFYTAQEFADTVGSPARMLVAQSVAEIHLRHFEESEATLQQLLLQKPPLPDALANAVVLKTLTGKDSTEELATLKQMYPSHPMVLTLDEKAQEFDRLASNYTFIEV